jgi:hypothetical protein
MNTAQTILQQLGGNSFVAMTGARHLCARPDGLVFKLPSNFAKDGINAVKITLDYAVDLYNVEFGRLRGVNYKEKSIHLGVYAEQLAPLFSEETGLCTIMPRIFTRASH